MTLYTNDYLEFYLTLVGWLINNGIWDMISDTGLFALPFLIIVVREWIKVRQEGADEGNKGVLSLARIETQLYIGYVVVSLCAIPVMSVGFDTLQFDQTRAKQCQVLLPAPGDTGWNTTFSSLTGKSARIPIWWAVMHSLSKGLNSGAVAAIPCGTDLRQMRMDVDAIRIDNPLLAQEVADFTHDCFGPSRARLFMRQPDLGAITKDPKTLQDLNWIGSRFLLNTSGYYDTDYSKTPRTAWPYDAKRDDGLPQVTGGGGYPTCKQWWSDGSIGLRDRLQAQVDPTLMNKLLGWAKWLSKDEVTDSMIRQVVSPSSQVNGDVYSDYGGQIGGTMWNGLARAGGTLGVGVGSLAYFPGMDIVRQALPMVMAFLKMAMVICLPLVLIIGAYQLNVAMTMSVVFFALIFVDFWFQLARWVDSTIIDVLYGSGSPHLSFDPVMGLNTTTQDAILNFVMGAMFIILPTFWVVALAWAGVKTGNIIGGLSAGTKDTQAAGKDGGKLAEDAIKTASR
ncbi:conjugal transfer protein TraG [Pseudomonas protegens]|uniref:conjugal transfer protein TraG N-terminal domain-containing protein n=1 Tax=Pseudomonas protegens TaxID=380021 RepID=UPI000806FF9A|nr:conjugal transfer protein TraG N-terminal domain-containing protein [Pseudomonas protegens]OBZ20208.1 conjugal transfer protein TraG [Pseudomonas protegens]OBZ21311.1 conjugal transfer protein TraG [Pseudomonas protegens]OKK40582.1 conjugal transfer protein TraG [Pseudomonas protegens]OKK52824.1 conjugal transfer protein TraG [Pseudomonas protegens]OKK58316.1 conjugal transfer protein TraG [Pseudomonas protegens]